VTIYTYHDNKADIWLEKNRASLSTNKKVKVFHIDVEAASSLENMLVKTMNLSCIIEEDQVHLSTDDLHVTVQITQSL
jgi:uncharacterized protein YaeQ